mmetsp:Transcript_14037/g.28393  ORF Transcript_14037/g.28393 Transcript_14037/m.28393 type:complete len:211 (-) Transcript_14037:458-1090(-)
MLGPDALPARCLWVPGLEGANLAEGGPAAITASRFIPLMRPPIFPTLEPPNRTCLPPKFFIFFGDFFRHTAAFSELLVLQCWSQFRCVRDEEVGDVAPRVVRRLRELVRMLTGRGGGLFFPLGTLREKLLSSSSSLLSSSLLCRTANGGGAAAKPRALSRVSSGPPASLSLHTPLLVLPPGTADIPRRDALPPALCCLIFERGRGGGVEE